MRSLTRTLPWIVILVVIAFFIGLKQTSDRHDRLASESSGKAVAKDPSTASFGAGSNTDKSTSPKALDATAVTEEQQDEEQEPVVILKAREGTAGTKKSPCPEKEKSPTPSLQPPQEREPKDQPDPTDGDPIDVKFFEGTVKGEESEPVDPSSSSELPAEEESADPATSETIDPPALLPSDLPSSSATTQFDSPVLLDLNPPVLNQPFNTPARDEPSSTEPETEDPGEMPKEDPGETPKEDPNADPNAMPSMYGPAKENVPPLEEPGKEENPSKKGDDPESTTDHGNLPPENQPLEKMPAPEYPVPREPFSPEMEKLRDGIRKTIEIYSQPILNTQDNTVAQLLDVCEAFGCDAEVMHIDKKRKINAFANLCYNYPCAGYRPLKVSDGRIEPQLGYGFQEQPGQMLAVMALARVPENYPLQFNENITGTVADLVEREKKTCRSGEDLSFKLIGIARYCPAGKSWKSENGQTWTVERLVQEVLAQPAKLDSVAGTNRLLALSYAINQRLQQEGAIDGSYAKAAEYLDEFQDYALSMLNEDGTWHPQFFKAKGIGGANEGRLRSTAHILRWLVFSLPEERLSDPRITKAISQVYRSLGGNARNGLAMASPRAIDAQFTAVHALVIYNDRFLSLYDTIEADPKPATGTAQSVRED